MAKLGLDEVHSIKNVIDYQINTVARGCHLEYAELFQIGYEGYLKARKNYNPEYGQMTLNYASKYIRHELIQALKQEYAYLNGHAAEPEDINADDYYDGTENPTDDSRISDIEKMVNKLPRQHRIVIKQFYLAKEPKRLKDLAADWGVSKQRIHQIKEQGLELIRRMIDDNS